MLAPICLFTYNRIEETKQTVESLRNNYLAQESELFIFSDGAKNAQSAKKVEDVRIFIKTITGFKTITIYESATNKGLAKSIISGVTQVISRYGKVIVLEDDLLTSPNFLDFMNQGLDFYKDNPKIHSISGYTLDLLALKKYSKDFYIGDRASSWGWATWNDKWKVIDWEIKGYDNFNKSWMKKIGFLKGGSDMLRMLNNQVNGNIDSWAIRFCFHQYLNKLYTIFPSATKVVSIGFGENATHTKKTTRFDNVLEDGKQTDFCFSKEFTQPKSILRDFRKKFSFVSRLKDKLL